jgi:protein-glutamine gamma-glutamyltransferase
MNSTLFFLAYSLVAWGWLLNTWAEAGLLLVIILLAKLTVWRWQITLTQFYRWGDLSSLLTVMLLLYFYFIQVTDRAIFVVLKWLPMLFAPLLFAQLFSTTQKLPLGALFYSFRKQQSNEQKELDFQLPYTVLTLLSAGAANLQNLNYFMIAIGLFVAILWQVRPAHSSKWLWLSLLTLAIITGHQGQLGLRRLQNILEYKSMEWLDGLAVDPFKTQTSIGDLGEMKLSDQIAFRVKATTPLYLMQASYDRYLGKKWGVSRYDFVPDNPVKASPNQTLQHLEILQQFHQREEILALPAGTVEITGISGSDFQYHSLGAVKIIDTPDFGNYQVFYTGKKTDAPSEYDLKIPKQHADWLLQLSGQLKLTQLKPPAVTETITAYFHKNFYYSLYLGSEPDADLALREFVLKRKAGHCEYFAVASVLLLRQAGIPARLVHGYVVEEYDPQQELYVVRYRHAHAWAIAYLEGAWQIVDSTPSQWLAMENEHASMFQSLSDWFSTQRFKFKQWQLQEGEKQNSLWLSGALLLTIYVGWRIYSARRQLIRETKQRDLCVEAMTYQGLDSEFYLIEQYFQATDFVKSKNESIQAWVKRLNQPELNALYQLHYQLRFDPQGLTSEHRKQLQQQVALWLASHKAAILPK